MRTWIKRIIYTILVVALFWSALTIWVENAGEQKIVEIGSVDAPTRVLMVYNPDPIYNLDEQVCIAMANGLAQNNCFVLLKTVKAAVEDSSDYDAYVICANTYNWAPDSKVVDFIEHHPNLPGSKVVALTLGAGSTETSQKKLEGYLNEKNVKLLHSQSLWLMRPNDENRMEEDNVEVASLIATSLGKDIALILNRKRN